MSIALQELEDKIEFDILRRISDLEHDVRDLRNKVLYDVPSKSERVQEDVIYCERTSVNYELISELKLQNALLKEQICEMRKLLLAGEKSVVIEKSKEADDKDYW